MSFQVDPVMAERASKYKHLGQYLITFHSVNGQARADLFDTGDQVIAHVTYPTGIDSLYVTDPYMRILENYAKEQGFGDRFIMKLASRPARV